MHVIYKEVSKIKVTNTLMPRTLFRLLYIYYIYMCVCVCGTWVAAGAHQTSTLSPLTFQHLPHHGTDACYSSTENMGIKCLWLGGDGLLHTGICCKSFVSQVLLKGSKEMDLLGPIMPTRLLTGYSAILT